MRAGRLKFNSRRSSAAFNPRRTRSMCAIRSRCSLLTRSKSCGFMLNKTDRSGIIFTPQKKGNPTQRDCRVGVGGLASLYVLRST